MPVTETSVVGGKPFLIADGKIDREARLQFATPIPSLDGMRAIAVLIVVLSHAGFGNMIPGGLGVTVFFFLSGYLITTLLVNEHTHTADIRIRLFYVRRFLRLFPPLAISLLVAYALVSLGILGGEVTVAGSLAQLFYFANYYAIFFPANAIPDGTGVLWSLAVEEHFYIIFPWLILPFLKRLKYYQIGLVLLLLCGLGLMWRVYLFTGFDFNSSRIYYASDTRFDSILFGAVLALMRNPSIVGVKNQTMRPVHWLAFVLGLSGILLSVVFRDPFFRETFRYTLQGLSLMPIFYCVIRFSDTFKLLNHPILVRIGVLSYSIYLIHLVLIYVLQKGIAIAPPGVLCFAIAFSLATLYAGAIEKYIDLPFRVLRAKFH